MIDTGFLFNELDGRVCLWCAADAVGTDLAAMTERAVDGHMPIISVAPDAVATVWPWLEKTSVRIFSRFYLDGFTVSSAGAAVSDLAVRINASFRRGAAGAQIFVRYRDLNSLVDMMRPVRDDLFFNKDLSIGVDIGDVNPCDLGAMFEMLRRINASSVVFANARDKGAKSDFVGRVYGLLGAWPTDWDGGLDFAFGDNAMRIEQAWRLVTSVRPQLMERTRFFING